MVPSKYATISLKIAKAALIPQPWAAAWALASKSMSQAPSPQTAACGLGTAAAAGHQLFQTLFLLSAVALGNPLSWAAQAFLPPLLAAYCAGREPGEVSQTAVVTLRKLVAFALCGSVPTSFLVVLFCRTSSSTCWLVVLDDMTDRLLASAHPGMALSSGAWSSRHDLLIHHGGNPDFCPSNWIQAVALASVLAKRKLGWLLSNDPSVLQVMAESSYSLVPFLMLYPVLLTLEAALSRYHSCQGSSQDVGAVCMRSQCCWRWLLAGSISSQHRKVMADTCHLAALVQLHSA
eukprot:s215_g9.t1